MEKLASYATGDNLVLTNLHGETLFKTNDPKNIDLTGMPPGIYLLSILDSDGVEIKTERLSYLG